MPSVPIVLEGENASDFSYFQSEAGGVSWRNAVSILSQSDIGELMKVDPQCLIQDIMHDTVKNSHRACALHLMVERGARKIDEFKLKYSKTQACLLEVESFLCNSFMGDDLKALDSSRKESQVMQELNVRYEEKDLVTETLKKKMAEFKALEDSSHKDSKVIEELNVRCEEKDLVIETLKMKVAEMEDSSRKDSKVIKELNVRCEEKDLVIETLKKKVAEFKALEDSSCKDSKVLHKLVRDLNSLEESSGKDSEDRDLLISKLESTYWKHWSLFICGNMVANWQEMVANWENMVTNSKKLLACWKDRFANLFKQADFVKMEEKIANWEKQVAEWKDIVASWEKQVANSENAYANWLETVVSWKKIFANWEETILVWGSILAYSEFFHITVEKFEWVAK